jgi:hypothetical protein
MGKKDFSIVDYIADVTEDVWAKTCYDKSADGIHYSVNPKTGIEVIGFGTEVETYDADSPYVTCPIELSIGFESYDDLRDSLASAVKAILNNEVIDALRSSDIYNLKIILGHDCNEDCECGIREERLEKWKAEKNNI